MSYLILSLKHRLLVFLVCISGCKFILLSSCALLIADKARPVYFDVVGLHWYCAHVRYDDTCHRRGIMSLQKFAIDLQCCYFYTA